MSNEIRSITSQVLALHTFLREKYKVVHACKPLAIGISEQVTALGYPTDVVRRTIGQHVKTTLYLKSIVKGGKRYNLDGTESSDVLEEHSKAAQTIVAERIAHFAAKKDAADARKQAEKEKLKREQSAKTAEAKKVKSVNILSKTAVTDKQPVISKKPPSIAPAVVVKKRRIINIEK